MVHRTGATCLALVMACVVLFAQAPNEATVDLGAADAMDQWVTEGDTWRIADGAIEQTDIGNIGTVAFLREPSVSDLALTVQMYSADEGEGVRAPGLVFRSQDSRNYYYAHYDFGNAQIILVLHTTDDPWIELGRVKIEPTFGEWHTGNIECEGSHIKVFFDGELMLEADDATLDRGLVGVRSGQGHVKFRDVRVEGASLALGQPWKYYEPPSWVIASDGGAGAYEAFPDVEKLDNGELFCVFYAGYAHVSLPNEEHPTGARIAYIRSTDEGRTWTEPRTLIDTERDDRDPSVVQLSDGTMICNWFTYHPDEDRRASIYVTRSTDRGETWSDPIPLPHVLSKSDAVSDKIREMPDGTLLMPIYGDMKEEPGWYPSLIIRSVDKGITWGDVSWIAKDQKVEQSEPEILRLDDGRLLCMIRPQMWQAYSSDDGYTWEPLVDCGVKGDAAFLLETSEGIILCAHRHPQTAVNYSLDEGATWSEAVILDHFGGAYPSMVELSDGSVLCVYYEEGAASNIRAVRFRATPDGIEIVGRPSE